MKLDAPRTEIVTVREAPITVRLNPPISVIAGIQSGRGDRMLDALRAIVVAHPFTLEDDVPATVDDFDAALVRDIIEAWAEAVKRLPPALQPTSP